MQIETISSLTSQGEGSNYDSEGDDEGGRIAREGDLIIVQERHDIVTHLTLEANGVLQNRFGRFLHSDVIGRHLGRRWDAAGRPGGVQGRTCKGFVYALWPNPALWTMAMHHRTQVVYPHDASIIALYLELRPGCIVIESGTGAGSASVAFASIVAPEGQVLSFEFHKERAEAARRDFEALGLSDVVTVVRECDVVNEGFRGVPDGFADAVFLDLPSPYHVVNEAARVLRAGGTLCSFSPCVEQVQRTCAALQGERFHSVRTMTAPVRNYESKTYTRSSPGFDRPIVTRHSNETMSSRSASQEDHVAIGNKRRRKMNSERTEINRNDVRACDASAVKEAVGSSGEQDKSDLNGACGSTRMTDEGTELSHVGRIVCPALPVRSRPFPEMKGHTSFLTFARRSRDADVPGKKSKGADVNVSAAGLRDSLCRMT